MKLEICVNSYGLLKQVIKNLDIPVFILIRPRGGSFVYSEDDFEIMKRDIQLCKDLGCQGIVSGILNADKTIDIDRTKQLITLSRPLQFTFHRAFDEVKNPKQALEQLIELGVERVLSSGQEVSAEEGLNLLKELNKISNGRITILVGGGVNSNNANKFKTNGLEEIHASASTHLEGDNSVFSRPITYSDPQKIKAILNAISI